MKTNDYKKLVFVWILIIFITMTIPKVPSQLEVPYLGDVVHFSEFFIFGFLVLKSFGKDYRSFGLGLFYGILTEIFQFFIPGRFFDFYDISLNLSGFLLGFFHFWFPLHINNYSRKNHQDRR